MISQSARGVPQIVHVPQHLPVLVLRAVERGTFRLGVDIEHALSAPGIGVRIVLHRAHAPLFALGHGVYRNRTQEADLLATLRFNSLGQFLKRRGIVLGVHLGLKHVQVGGIFVAVDGVAHFPQRLTEFFFFLALNRDPRQGQSHQRENRHDGRRDDQLHERETPLRLRVRPVMESRNCHCLSSVSQLSHPINVFGVDENFPQGLKSMRENWCRPSGTRSLIPSYPALTCRAITCRRFAAGFWWCLFHPSPRNPVLTRSLKPSSEGELYRSAKSAAPPKSELFSEASFSARPVRQQREA